MRIVAVLLIVLGVVGLIYGGITYTSRSHDAHVGPIDISIKEKKTVPIPVWVGVAAIVVGAVLLLGPGRT